MMQLTVLTPDSTRSRQVRANCRRRLERSRRRSDRLAAVAHVGRRVIAPVVALVGAAYIVNLAGVALQTLSRAR